MATTLPARPKHRLPFLESKLSKSWCQDFSVKDSSTGKIDRWVDSSYPDGDSCCEYDRNPHWCQYAAQYANQGYDATDICCVCGGGKPSATQILEAYDANCSHQVAANSSSAVLLQLVDTSSSSTSSSTTSAESTSTTSEPTSATTAGATTSRQPMQSDHTGRRLRLRRWVRQWQQPEYIRGRGMCQLRPRKIQSFEWNGSLPDLRGWEIFEYHARRNSLHRLCCNTSDSHPAEHGDVFRELHVHAVYESRQRSWDHHRRRRRVHQQREVRVDLPRFIP